MKTDILIIGGGAAGLVAAGSAARVGGGNTRVVVLEKNAKVGRKIGITGKGRCNCTNDCDTRQFMENVVTNPRFLYAALSQFGPADTMALLEEAKVPLKVERGRRVFPVSDRSFDVIDGLSRYARFGGTRIQTESAVTALEHLEDGSFRVKTTAGSYEAPCVIVATGGLSYPTTGSTGDGLRFAAKLGLTVTDLLPALIPLTAAEPWCKELMGLTLKNVAVRYTLGKDGKTIYKDFGELLFTHFGVSGPTVLSASSYLQQYLRKKQQSFPEANIHLHVDLKSALEEAALDERIRRDLEKHHLKAMAGAMEDLLPSRMIRLVLQEADIDPTKQAAQLKKDERQRLVKVLKDLTLSITGTRPIEEATVTQGGVEVKQVDPSTMMVKSIPGLFLAGEILDVDALTGGYNLQIAFSTGYLAGKAAADYIRSRKS